MSQMPEDGSSPYGDLPYAMAGIRRRSSPYDRQRTMAYSIMQQGMDTSPIAHPMQGVSRLAQALVGSLMANRADEQEAAATKQRQDAWTQAASIADPQERLAAMGKIDPEMGARYAGQVAMQEIAAKRKAEENRGAADTFLAGFGGGPQVAGQGGPAGAIAGIESGGRYDAVGPETGKGRALGKFQVMSFNVAPWTKEVLGQEMTPEQFLASPEAQEKVFQSKFGSYVQKYGPGGAARAWFAGEGGMNNPNAADVNGMTVANYEKKFLAAGGAGQQDGGPGMMPTPQPPGAAPQMPRPTEIPKPQPDPQIMQQAYGLLQTGKITPVQAQQMVMDDVNRRWQIAVTETSADRRQAASDAAAAQRDVQRQAAEERKQNMPSQAEMAKFREAKSEGGRIIAALNDFRAEADKDSGWRSVMGATTPANTAYNTAALLAKGEALFNLGVLNGPDLDIIRRTLPDPSTVRGAFMTTPKEREAAVNKVIRVIEDGIARKERVLGLAPSAPQQEAPQQGQGGGGGGIVPPPDAVDAELRRRGLLK
jgi:hypothetical protein